MLQKSFFCFDSPPKTTGLLLCLFEKKTGHWRIESRWLPIGPCPSLCGEGQTNILFFFLRFYPTDSHPQKDLFLTVCLLFNWLVCSNNIFCWKTGQHSFNRYNKTIEERGQRLSIGRRIDTCAYIVYVKYTHTRVLGGPKFTFLAGNQVRFFFMVWGIYKWTANNQVQWRHRIGQVKTSVGERVWNIFWLWEITRAKHFGTFGFKRLEFRT